ncbi:MAG TPA: pantoate--beta-alanine ligase [Xanthomonadales bacterium]|nr:pantoate--beta-alanine ligase [Xanthomonadales bacterium]
MQVFDSLQGWRAWRAGVTRPLGFVPTMGALHRGHLSLVQRSLADNPVTVASIYVNPTQFNNPVDLEKYPRTEQQDLALLEDAGVDAVLYPAFDELYPDGYRYRVVENELSLRFCGAHRPGHFDGVLSVVLKLLNIIAPRRAYFGEKDYQQLSLVRGMAEAFMLPVEIIGCPTVREPDGLAMSSRNLRLDPQQRALAPELYRIINTAGDCKTARDELARAGFKVDYVEDLADAQGVRRLAAASLGEIRLIDNVVIE